MTEFKAGDVVRVIDRSGWGTDYPTPALGELCTIETAQCLPFGRGQFVWLNSYEGSFDAKCFALARTGAAR